MAMINETLAKRSFENYSFSDYKPGSATAEYNAAVAEATEKIEKAKQRVSNEGKERLDNLLSRYARRLADWTNNHNANGSRHVSQMIAGPSNYNMRAHEKFMSRESKLWEEYNEIIDIDNKILSIIHGDKIIKSDDANAIEKLQDKIKKLQDAQDMMKASNKIIKSKKLTDAEKVEEMVKIGMSEKNAKDLLEPDFCGRIGFASYSLTNNNATIRTAKERLAKLEKLAKIAEATPQIEIATEPESGVKILDNLEAQRVQILFPDKPSADCRNELKRSGFRWAPSANAWQAYRGYNVIEKAKAIVNKYY